MTIQSEKHPSLNQKSDLRDRPETTEQIFTHERNPMIPSMTQSKTAQAAGFPAEEHLRVQREIEQCARDLWRTGGCRPDRTLNDWLEAEREVMEQLRLRLDEPRFASPGFRQATSRTLSVDPGADLPTSDRAERRRYSLNSQRDRSIRNTKRELARA